MAVLGAEGKTLGSKVDEPFQRVMFSSNGLITGKEFLACFGGPVSRVAAPTTVSTVPLAARQWRQVTRTLVISRVPDGKITPKLVEGLRALASDPSVPGAALSRDAKKLLTEAGIDNVTVDDVVQALLIRRQQIISGAAVH